MLLNRFDNREFDRGRPSWVEGLWLVVQALLLDCWLPGSAHRALLLRLFGAKLGNGVVFKPRLRVKFPWRLQIGDHVWLGEGVWIDNLDTVIIGNHVCVSQGAYFCTGSHDMNADAFDLEVKPIRLADHVWICARATVGPGVTVGEGAILALGGVATRDLLPWCVYGGVPARPIANRSDPRLRQRCQRQSLAPVSPDLAHVGSGQVLGGADKCR